MLDELAYKWSELPTAAKIGIPVVGLGVIVFIVYKRNAASNASAGGSFISTVAQSAGGVDSSGAGTIPPPVIPPPVDNTPVNQPGPSVPGPVTPPPVTPTPPPNNTPPPPSRDRFANNRLPPSRGGTADYGTAVRAAYTPTFVPPPTNSRSRYQSPAAATPPATTVATPQVPSRNPHRNGTMPIAGG